MFKEGLEGHLDMNGKGSLSLIQKSGHDSPVLSRPKPPHNHLTLDPFWCPHDATKL